jgi:hypothetical protein
LKIPAACLLAIIAWLHGFAFAEPAPATALPPCPGLQNNAFRADLYRWRATCLLGNGFLDGSSLVRNSSPFGANYGVWDDDDIAWGDAYAHIVWWRDLDEEDFVRGDDDRPSGPESPLNEAD